MRLSRFGRDARATAALRRRHRPARGKRLLQLIRDLVDAGLGAGFVLVAAGRAGDANRADHVVADLDRQRAARRDHVAEAQRAGAGSLGDVVGELAGGDALARAR